MYTLYTRASCNLCEIAKKYLTENNEPYKLMVIDVDTTREYVLTKYPHAKTLPVVVYDEKFIGGKDELIEHVKARKDAEQK